MALVRVGVFIWYSIGLSYWGGGGGLFPQLGHHYYWCEGHTLVHMDLTLTFKEFV